MAISRNVLLWLVLWLIWTILAYPMCLKDCCADAGAADEDVGLVEENEQAPDAGASTTAAARGPLDFAWSAARPNTNTGFEAFRNDLLAGRTENNILEIVGLYYEGEDNPERDENLGLARARLTRALLVPDLPDERVNLRARLQQTDADLQDSTFAALEFRWLEPEQKIAATVEELADRQIVRFPFNSTEKEYDPAVDEYLQKLAQRVRETGEQVRLVGHTDNVGGDDANMVLSDRRAKVIRDILRRQGVPDNQITTEAKGESQPVASNETEEGRYDNRRVEIFLIKANNE